MTTRGNSPPNLGGEFGSAQSDWDGLNQAFKIFKNILVLESKYRDVKAFQKFRSDLIRLRPRQREMTFPIQLDSQTTFSAVKIDNKRTYAVCVGETSSHQVGNS